MLGTLNETKDILYFLAHGDLLRDLDNSIFQTEITRINDAISVGDMT